MTTPPSEKIRPVAGADLRDVAASRGVPSPAPLNGDRPNRFGTGPDQSIPKAWADRMLTRLAADHRAVFVKLLGEAALGAEPSP